MQYNTLLICVFLFVWDTSALADSPRTLTDRRLNGGWVVVQAEREGRVVADFRSTPIYIDGNSIKWKMGDTLLECSLIVHPWKSPAPFDQTITMPNLQTVEILGIYEFKSDKLLVCLTALGAQRPISFDTNSDKQWIKFELIRPKSTKRPD